MRQVLGLYGLLVRLLPVRIRRRQGALMRELFAEQLASVSSGELIRSALGGLFDLMLRIPYEHWRHLRQGYAGEGVMLNSLGFEVKQGLRMLRRQPGASALVVAMLALGIAANTVVFTFVNTAFLRPLPWDESGRLVYLNERAPKWNLEETGINFPDFAVWRDGARAFEHMTLYSGAAFNVSEGGVAERVQGVAVTYDFLSVLRIKPVLGRGFTAAEDKPDGARVALISSALWSTRFGGADDVLGRTLRINSVPHTIVGVLPEEARFPNDAQIWVPLRGDRNQQGQSYSFNGMARLRPGVTLAAAQADLERVHEPIWEEHDRDRNVSPLVMPLRTRLFGELRPGLLALGGGVAIVLLITCANVSSVLLARATARRREIGIRRALGASQKRIARQVLMENALLSLAGAGLGVLSGIWTVRALLPLLPEEAPPWVRLDADLRMVAFGLAAALFTALVAGLAPLLQTTTADTRESLVTRASDRASATRGQRRTLNGLVIAEVALACVLLVGGGLLVRAYNRVQNIDPGFNPENVLAFDIALPNSKYSSDTQRRQFFERTLAELRTLPGVQHAGAITCPPLTCHWGNFLDIEGAPARTANQQDPVILMRIASPDYDRAIGLRQLSGRFLSHDDLRPNAPRAIVINEAFARTFYNGQDPVGRRVKFRGDSNWMTIVGVTHDVKHYGLGEPMRPGIYLPETIVASSTMAVLLRVTSDPMSVAEPARQVVQRLDPELPLFAVRTMTEAVHNSLGLQRTYSWLLAVFAAVALVLAIGGIYGVLSYVVGQRRREISIRMAMGAQRNSVLALVLRHGAVLAGTGIIIGVLASLAVARLLTGLLFGLPPFDVLTYGTVIAAVTITALAAAAAPARRAISFEPQSALRE